MIADYANRRIQILDHQLNHIKDITQAGDGQALSRPIGICINSKGDIIISDYSAHRVLVYDKTGLYKRDIPGPWRGPWGIAVDNDDTLYICEALAGRIKVIGKDGGTIRTFGEKGTTAGRFDGNPWYITVYGDTLVISDATGRVYHFTMRGEFIKNMESGIVKKASGLTVSPAGDLIIVDEKGEVVVVRDGRVVCRVGETGGESWHLDRPLGVEVTNTGQVVVANFGKDNLLLYDMVKKTYAN